MRKDSRNNSRSFILEKYPNSGYSLNMSYRVDLEAAKKDIKKAPVHIVRKLMRWVKDVESQGLEEVRKVRGWWDHTLEGEKKGRRAISLNDQWRAEYVVEDGEIKIVKVLEVHPHDY